MNNNDINNNTNNVVNNVYPNPVVNNVSNGVIDPNSINSVVNGPSAIPVNNNSVINTTPVDENANVVKGSFIERFRTKLNNFGKTKTFKIIFVVAIVLITLFLLFKLFLVILFNKINTYPKFIVDYNNRSSFSVSTNEYELGESDALYFGDVSFVNFLDDSFLSEDIKGNNGDKGILYKSSTWNSSLEIKSDDTFVNTFINDSKSYSKGVNAILSGTTGSRKNYLEKNSVNSDVDLFNLIYKNMDTDVSFTSSISEIMKIGALKLFASNYLPSADKIMILAGNYDGYILVTKKWKSN